MPVTIHTTAGDDLRAAQQQAGSTPLDTMSVSQAVTWINTNVTDLASAKTLLVVMAKLMFQMDRRIKILESQPKKA